MRRVKGFRTPHRSRSTTADPSHSRAIRQWPRAPPSTRSGDSIGPVLGHPLVFLIRSKNYHDNHYIQRDGLKPTFEASGVVTILKTNSNSETFCIWSVHSQLSRPIPPGRPPVRSTDDTAPSPWRAGSDLVCSIVVAHPPCWATPFHVPQQRLRSSSDVRLTPATATRRLPAIFTSGLLWGRIYHCTSLSGP